VSAWRTLALRGLRYPGPIEAPEGTPGKERTLRPSPRYLRYTLVKRLPAVLLTLALEEWFRHRILSTLNRHANVPPLNWQLSLAVELAIFLVAFAVPTAVHALDVYLHYIVKTYVLTDRALRVRDGVWFVRETTMAMSRVQDIVVTRGPLQGLFGISDIVVRSAGGAGGGHTIRLEAMAEVDAIEVALRELTKQAPEPPRNTTVEASVAALLSEARSLRMLAENREPPRRDGATHETA